MKGRIFVDTNIFVYYFQAQDDPRKTKARELIDQNFSYISISVQVLGELFNVLKKKGIDKLNCICY